MSVLFSFYFSPFLLFFFKATKYPPRARPPSNRVEWGRLRHSATAYHRGCREDTKSPQITIRPLLESLDRINAPEGQGFALRLGRPATHLEHPACSWLCARTLRCCGWPRPGRGVRTRRLSIRSCPPSKARCTTHYWMMSCLPGQPTSAIAFTPGSGMPSGSHKVSASIDEALPKRRGRSSSAISSTG